MKKSRIKYNNGGHIKQTTADDVFSLEARARGNNNDYSGSVTASAQGGGFRGSTTLFKNDRGYTATTVEGGYSNPDKGFSLKAQQQRDNYGNKNTNVRVAKGPFSATASKNKGGTDYGLRYEQTTRKGTTFGVGVNRNAQGLLSANMSVSKSL